MTNSAHLPPVIDGLSRIAADYDGLICDIWGVMHDGRTPNPPAIAALQKFRGRRGPVLLLSNAPRVAGHVVAQFGQVGVPRDCYDAILTSGEATRLELAARAAQRPPMPIFHLGPERDANIYQGLPVECVSKAQLASARLVLCTGLFDDTRETPADYDEMLDACGGLEMLCANPDITVRRGHEVVYCAGALAQAYEKKGGKVKYFGKPYPPVFEAALARLAQCGSTGRVLVIGDGPSTDILGANRMALDSLFIAGGLHAAKTGDLADATVRAGIAELFAEAGARANAMMTELAW